MKLKGSQILLAMLEEEKVDIICGYIIKNFFPGFSQLSVFGHHAVKQDPESGVAGAAYLLEIPAAPRPGRNPSAVPALFAGAPRIRLFSIVCSATGCNSAPPRFPGSVSMPLHS